MTLIKDIVAPPGGVMTDEVGVVTGDLTLETVPAEDGTVTLRVQYQGAEEWYRVTGASVRVPDPHDEQAVDKAEGDLLARFTG